jgi:hypothetical protein
MSRGLKLPVGVDATGGAAMVEGEDDNYQVIMTALSDCDNEHAFQQDVGLGADMIFDINDPITRAKILRRVKMIFDQFEAQHRFRLLTDTIRWSVAEGDLSLEFMYHDIESDEDKPFARTFTSG